MNFDNYYEVWSEVLNYLPVEYVDVWQYILENFDFGSWVYILEVDERGHGIFRVFSHELRVIPFELGGNQDVKVLELRQRDTRGGHTEDVQRIVVSGIEEQLDVIGDAFDTFVKQADPDHEFNDRFGTIDDVVLDNSYLEEPYFNGYQYESRVKGELNLYFTVTFIDTEQYLLQGVIQQGNKERIVKELQVEWPKRDILEPFIEDLHDIQNEGEIYVNTMRERQKRLEEDFWGQFEEKQVDKN